MEPNLIWLSQARWLYSRTDQTSVITIRVPQTQECKGLCDHYAPCKPFWACTFLLFTVLASLSIPLLSGCAYPVHRMTIQCYRFSQISARFSYSEVTALQLTKSDFLGDKMLLGEFFIVIQTFST